MQRCDADAVARLPPRVPVGRAEGDPSLAVVRACVAGRMPGQEQLVVTSVTPQGVDISRTRSLLLPQWAGGAGDVWRDGVAHVKRRMKHLPSPNSGLA